MKVSGSNNMLEMRKGNRRYILIGDVHDPWNTGNCKDKDSILITEFLDKLFTKYTEKQWDFYLEQGSYDIENEDEVISFLSEMDTVLTDTERKKLLTFQIYQFADLTICPSLNVYFSFEPQCHLMHQKMKK